MSPAAPPSVLALIGLERSGTTLAGALLDAHPRIDLLFEPWNSTRHGDVARPEQSAEQLLARHGRRPTPGASVFAIKEVTVARESTQWVAAFLSHHQPALVVWAIRRYAHTYLSLTETAREHWGHRDRQVGGETFHAWVASSLERMRGLHEVAAPHRTILYSYEALVTEPRRVLADLLAEVGLTFDPVQLSFFRTMDPRTAVGDPKLNTNPRPIDPSEVLRREYEWGQVAEALAAAQPAAAGAMRSLNALSDVVRSRRVCVPQEPDVAAALRTVLDASLE